MPGHQLTTDDRYLITHMHQHGFCDAAIARRIRGRKNKGSGVILTFIETRDGSDLVLKQYVWGHTSGGYIDELVQTSINDDPADAAEDNVESHYWVLQNANYNVMMLIDDSGTTVERYEYTPYGQRQVYFSAGTNDPLAMSPTSISRRVEVSSVDQPYGLCEIGHQGLYHDEESGLVYNRARIQHTRLGRFTQRDPLNQDQPGGGYQDGMSLYQYVRSQPISFTDPTGAITAKQISHCDQIRSMCHTRATSYSDFIQCDQDYNECLSNPPSPQDAVCSRPAGAFNYSPCMKQCCMEHDNCYMRYGCTSKSWPPPIGSSSGPSQCKCCNSNVKSCIAKCASKNGVVFAICPLCPILFPI